jgi:hypothetical protein
MDRLQISDIETQRLDQRHTRVTYHAKLQVAWGKPDQIPAEYTFTLPRDAGFFELTAFANKYKFTCVKWGAASRVTASSMWYYYRPDAHYCDLNPADVVTFTAKVSPSDVQTHGKYPEYHKVWEDGELRVMAIFAKNVEGSVSSSDGGIRAYNAFVADVRNALAGRSVTTAPAEVPDEPGWDSPEITFEAPLDATHRVTIVAALVDHVATARRTFDDLYEEHSPRADLIVYNGHSGLGHNIKTLAEKGTWVSGQYVIVFLNGCSTYAYLDSALTDAHKQVNPDDTTGSKYLDLVVNAMASEFEDNAPATMALVRALMAYDAPKAYDTILEDVPPSQVVLVSGEQDNVYVPEGTE